MKAHQPFVSALLIGVIALPAANAASHTQEPAVHNFVATHSLLVESLLEKQLANEVDKATLAKRLKELNKKWQSLTLSQIDVKPAEQGFWCGLNALVAEVEDVYSPRDRRTLAALSLMSLRSEKPMPKKYNCYAWPYHQPNVITKY